ncbi:16S rRNA (guanine(966)-N(2))-methyltransferase RsmD [Tateyamaria omphalii]|uniref:16S rRNA (Guanine(966)-N(2))-methyltransferase RsmD n=1 Tax=Tateyamaria omphalii TaxID=299262 RepID=A0A1P8MXN2_9RHOB|nr:16S rRNA (guanine(966)-N(2))-methyltransferase RsmD [Tateyamaria omphalii]APX12824.1 16S rRNA (guanine(966)-N(2))-methyltransferase RsmD [Tateyamaria omphalii]
MRIIAGRWRGVPLANVGRGDAQAHLRPTPDRVRESLFSMLTHRGVIDGAHVLDLFAGTGALGLEALSRGAAHVTFAENGRVGQKLIAENIKKLNAGDQTKLLRLDATKPGELGPTPFNLIFLDPPYGKGMGEKALAAIRTHCADDALIVWEENAAMDPPAGYALLDRRRFGSTHVTLLETA